VRRRHQLGTLTGVQHPLELTGDLEQLLRGHARGLLREQLTHLLGIGAQCGDALSELGAGHTSVYSIRRSINKPSEPRKQLWHNDFQTIFEPSSRPSPHPCHGPCAGFEIPARTDAAGRATAPTVSIPAELDTRRFMIAGGMNPGEGEPCGIGRES
jgi:hypothetical protein